MYENKLDPSGLKFLWKHRGNEKYDLKSFISDGTFIQYIVFEDKRTRQDVLGKIVTSPGEGEAYHWPRLQHENLIPLLDTVSINETKSVYIFPFIGKSIGNVIHDFNFLNDPQCFNRKKAYAEDILWALDYLHGKSLCLMNLTDVIIYICNASDKAVIYDFSCVFLIERATEDKIQLPTLYQAPEINTTDFEPIAAETWACGVMLLQIFTGHILPSAFVNDEVHQVVQGVREINYDLIKETNPGYQLRDSDVENLKKFLDLFLVCDPKKRTNIELAAVSSFIRHSRRTKIKGNSFNEQLMESKATKTRHFQELENRDNKHKNSEIFKEIYLKEAAKYRNKLRQLPCTNKFINLDFVSEWDGVTKSHENQHCAHRKSSKTNRIAEKVLTDAQFDSDIDSEESIIGDNQGVTSELFENDSSIEFLNEICSSKLGEKFESLGDVTGGNLHHSINDYLRNSYLDRQKFSDISISSYGEDSVIRDILDDHEKNDFVSKSRSSFMQMGISTDSLDNAEISLATASKLNYSDSKCQSIEVLPCSKLEHERSKFSFPQKKRHYISEEIQTQQPERKSDSNLGISVKHKKNLIPSKSDSCIANVSNVQNKSDEFQFLDKKFLGGYSNSCNFKQIMLLDSANLNKTSDNDVAAYTWQSYGVIKKPITKALQIQSLDLHNKCTASHLTVEECSQSMDNKYSNHIFKSTKSENSTKNLKLCDGENKNLEENMKNGKDRLKSIDCNQYKEAFNDCLNQKNSYDQGMLQEKANVIKSKPVDSTSITNSLMKLRRMKTSPFKNLINKNKFNSKKQSNVSCLSKVNDCNYPREDEFPVEQNSTMTITTLGNTTLDMDASLLNNEQGKYKKKGKKSQERKNKWIRYLCPGSKC